MYKICPLCKQEVDEFSRPWWSSFAWGIGTGILTLVCLYAIAWMGMHAFDEPDIFWPLRWLGL